MTVLRTITLSLALACASVAHAQTRDAEAENDTADIARCLVAENVSGEDWPAILDVLARRARTAHVTVARMARLYCAVHRAVTPTKRQARIRALPAPESTSRLLRSFQRALIAARRGGPGTCSANHWGDLGSDFVRATRLGWTRVRCGETRNAFWSSR